MPGPIDEIFVPYDFSEPAADALRYRGALAELYGATLTLVHVIHDLTVPMEYEVDVPEMATANVPCRAEAALQKVASERHRVLVTTGNPGRRIVEVAEEHDADLLVLSTHGRTGLRRLLIGSVAEQVIRQAPCPVFIVKAFAPSQNDVVADAVEKADEYEWCYCSNVFPTRLQSLLRPSPSASHEYGSAKSMSWTRSRILLQNSSM